VKPPLGLAALLLLSACGDPQVRVVTHGETGQTIERSEWSGGHRHGLFRVFYAGGERQLESRWEHGLRCGRWTWWHESGCAMKSGAFRDGLREEEWSEWYESGQLKWRGLYRGGAKHGTWRHWSPAGELYAEEDWEEGTRLAVRLSSG